MYRNTPVMRAAVWHEVVGGSKQLRRPTSNFEEEFDQIWSSISGRSRVDLGQISDLGSISVRSLYDLSRISDLESISSRSRSTGIKITSSSTDLPVKSIGRLSLHRSKLKARDWGSLLTS